MGQRGPQPLPANVHRLRGNPSKLPASRLADDVQPEVEIPGCPKHLLPEARKEWKRIGPELQRLGLIAKIDRAALALYCQAWARLVWAEEQLAGAMRASEVKRQAAEERGEVWEGGDGVTVITASGHATYSPHWVISNRAQQQVESYLRAFGMSPSSRGRVTASSRQADLFGDGAGEGAPPPPASSYFGD